MTSKSYKFIRTPKDIWKYILQEMEKIGLELEIDACASDDNYLLPKYWTKKTNCLKQDWTGKIVYCHPMFDGKIGKFVEKAATEKSFTVMLLPAATHTRYFHKWIWDKERHRPKSQVRVDFLEKPTRGFNFGHEDGTFEEIKAGRVGYIKPLMIVYFNNL